MKLEAIHIIGKKLDKNIIATLKLIYDMPQISYSKWGLPVSTISFKDRWKGRVVECNSIRVILDHDLMILDIQEDLVVN